MKNSIGNLAMGGKIFKHLFASRMKILIQNYSQQCFSQIKITLRISNAFAHPDSHTRKKKDNNKKKKRAKIQKV